MTVPSRGGFGTLNRRFVAAIGWIKRASRRAAIASEYVIFVNRIGQEHGLDYWGGSYVVGPSGEIVAEASGLDAGVTVAEVDLAEVTRWRRRAPLVREARLAMLSRGFDRLAQSGGDLQPRRCSPIAVNVQEPPMVKSAEERLPRCERPSPEPGKPTQAAPRGAWDCHAHIFGPVDRYRLHSSRSYDPAPASLEACRALLATLGIEHAVIVQPSVNGTDNRCTMDAVSASGGQWRGVAVVDAAVSARELRQLHAAGFRGVRFNLLFRGGTALEQLETIARKIEPLGWLVQLLLDGRDLPSLASRLSRLPVPFVIDHMGHFPVSNGGDFSAPLRSLLSLLENAHGWAKLSGPYRLSTADHPYPGTGAIARSLVAHAPERLVWGSDWPHPAIRQAVPDDGLLFDLLQEWAPEARLPQRILVDNPARLYC